MLNIVNSNRYILNFCNKIFNSLIFSQRYKPNNNNITNKIMGTRKFEDKDHAKVYHSFRPQVPQQVIDIALNFLSEKINKNEWETAVDVGCGTGQCTNVLAQYFIKVYGFDVSSAQLEEAKNNDHPINVHYDLSSADNLPSIKSGSVQLVTASSAAHFFDFPSFFKEVNRVLVNKGVVALFSFFLMKPINPFKPDDQRLAQLIKDVYYDPLIIGYQDSHSVKTRETKYRNIRFPDEYHYVYRDNITVKRETSADKIIGRLKSMSHYHHLVKLDKVEAQKFIEKVEQQFRDILGVSDLSETKLFYNCQYFIAMARKP